MRGGGVAASTTDNVNVEQDVVTRSKNVFIHCFQKLREALVEFLPADVDRVLSDLNSSEFTKEEKLSIKLRLHQQIVDKGGLAPIAKIGKLIREMSEIVNTLRKIYGVEAMRTMFNIGKNSNGDESINYSKIHELILMMHKWVRCVAYYSKIEKAYKGKKGFRSGGRLGDPFLRPVGAHFLRDIHCVGDLFGDLRCNLAEAFHAPGFFYALNDWT